MRRHSVLWVIGCLLCAVAAAQEAGGVSDDLIRRADVIVRCTVLRVTPVEGGVNLRIGAALRGFLKGSEEVEAWPLFVPDRLGQTFRERDTCTLFLQADITNKRTLLLEDKEARRPGDQATAQAIGERARAMRALKVELGAERPAYVCGEPVVLLWAITNQGAAPVSVYVGRSAYQYTYSAGGASIGTGTTSYPRKPEDYRKIAPGERYEHRVTLREIISRVSPPPPILFPEGSLRVTMTYDGSSNWLGTTAQSATGRVEDAALAREERSIVVTIAAPDDAAVAALARKLASPVWVEQRDAMRILCGARQAAALPEVRRMAAHPWAEVRKLAARALAPDGREPAPEVRALTADPWLSVREEASQGLRQSRPGGGGLRLVPVAPGAGAVQQHAAETTLALYVCLTASKEAQERGVVARSASLETELNNRGDQRLGDILCARVEAGKGEAWLLNRLLPRERRPMPAGPGEPTEEQRRQLVATWREVRGEVADPVPMARFEQEMAAYRARAFDDFRHAGRAREVGEVLRRAAREYNHYGTEADAQALAGLGQDAVPTILLLLRNNSYTEYDAGLLFRQLAAWGAKDAVPILVARALEGDPYAAASAFELDPAFARRQLEGLLESNEGVAVALAKLGEKRAVPYVMAQFGRRAPGWTAEQSAALAAATGKPLGIGRWQYWWKEEGSKLEWK